MTDDDMQHSGSRWEPAPGRPGAEAAAPQDFAAPSVPVGTGPYAATATALPAGARDGSERRPSGGRGLMAGIAAGFLLIGGVGGFALGHATSGNDGGLGTSSVQGGLPGTGGQGGTGGVGEFPGRPDPDGDHFRHHDDGDGAGGAPGGTPPGQGGTTAGDGSSGTT